MDTTEEKFVDFLHAIVASAGNKNSQHDIARMYKSSGGRDPPFREYGASSLLEFCRRYPGKFQVRGNSICAQVTAETKHVTDQLGSSKSKASRGGRGRGGGGGVNLASGFGRGGGSFASRGGGGFGSTRPPVNFGSSRPVDTSSSRPQDTRGGFSSGYGGDSGSGAGYGGGTGSGAGSGSGAGYGGGRGSGAGSGSGAGYGGGTGTGSGAGSTWPEAESYGGGRNDRERDDYGSGRGSNYGRGGGTVGSSYGAARFEDSNRGQRPSLNETVNRFSSGYDEFEEVTTARRPQYDRMDSNDRTNDDRYYDRRRETRGGGGYNDERRGSYDRDDAYGGGHDQYDGYNNRGGYNDDGYSQQPTEYAQSSGYDRDGRRSPEYDDRGYERRQDDRYDNRRRDDYDDYGRPADDDYGRRAGDDYGRPHHSSEGGSYRSSSIPPGQYRPATASQEEFINEYGRSESSSRHDLDDRSERDRQELRSRYSDRQDARKDVEDVPAPQQSRRGFKSALAATATGDSIFTPKKITGDIQTGITRTVRNDSQVGDDQQKDERDPEDPRQHKIYPWSGQPAPPPNMGYRDPFTVPHPPGLARTDRPCPGMTPPPGFPTPTEIATEKGLITAQELANHTEEMLLKRKGRPVLVNSFCGELLATVNVDVAKGVQDKGGPLTVCEMLAKRHPHLALHKYDEHTMLIKLEPSKAATLRKNLKITETDDEIIESVVAEAISRVNEVEPGDSASMASSRHSSARPSAPPVDAEYMLADKIWIFVQDNGQYSSQYNLYGFDYAELAEINDMQPRMLIDLLRRFPDDFYIQYEEHRVYAKGNERPSVRRGTQPSSSRSVDGRQDTVVSGGPPGLATRGADERSLRASSSGAPPGLVGASSGPRRYRFLHERYDFNPKEFQEFEDCTMSHFIDYLNFFVRFRTDDEKFDRQQQTIAAAHFPLRSSSASTDWMAGDCACLVPDVDNAYRVQIVGAGGNPSMVRVFAVDIGWTTDVDISDVVPLLPEYQSDALALHVGFEDFRTINTSDIIPFRRRFKTCAEDKSTIKIKVHAIDSHDKFIVSIKMNTGVADRLFPEYLYTSKIAERIY